MFLGRELPWWDWKYVSSEGSATERTGGKLCSGHEGDAECPSKDGCRDDQRGFPATLIFINTSWQPSGEQWPKAENKGREGQEAEGEAGSQHQEDNWREEVKGDEGKQGQRKNSQLSSIRNMILLSCVLSNTPPHYTNVILMSVCPLMMEGVGSPHGN